MDNTENKNKTGDNDRDRSGSGQSETQEFIVQQIVQEAEAIKSYELVSASDIPLIPFSAGSHIDVYLPDGLTRQYSLCSDPKEKHRYVIAVLHEPESRGGSRCFHDQVKSGDRLEGSRPRNLFPLAPNAQSHLLLAGGIGVTPMMAMVDTLQREGANYRMYYCTRNLERTAFLDRLKPLIANGNVILHHDNGEPRDGP